EAICKRSCRTGGQVTGSAKAREPARATCALLAFRRRCAGGMACSGAVPAGDAIASLASDRTRFVLCGRPSILVALCPAVAGCAAVAGVVDASVPLPRDLAVRRSFWLTCILRPCRIPDVSLHASAVRAFGSRRSAVRRSAHVDRRYGCLSG